MARKILLADDSVTAQNMGRKILADAGYEVVTVNNGSAALKKIAESRPDLIVLDVYMPGYSGLEVCQRLKENADSAKIPVLLTVGKLEPFKPEEAKRARADGFIVKPFEASELLSALTKLEERIVPRAEGSKPGRFARSIAAIEEGRYDRSMAVEEDSGWKNRIGFPHEKKAKSEEKEDGDDPAIYNAVNKDLRTTVEHEKPHVAEPASHVNVSALAPAVLPKDVTPEEIAALAAAAAQVQRGIDSAKKEEPLETKTQETKPEVASQSAPVEPKIEAKFEEPAPQTAHDEPVAAAQSETEAPSATKVEEAAEAIAPKEEENAAAATEAVPVLAHEVYDQPVTMAVAAMPEPATAPSRWSAVAVALAPEESSISLENEMRAATAAYAEFSAPAAESHVVEPAVAETSPPEVAQALEAVASIATEAISNAIEQLESSGQGVHESPAVGPEESAAISHQPSRTESLAEAISPSAANEIPAIEEAKQHHEEVRDVEAAMSEPVLAAESREVVAEQPQAEQALGDPSPSEPSEVVPSVTNETPAEQLAPSAEAPETVHGGADDMARKESEIAEKTAAAWASWRRVRGADPKHPGNNGMPQDEAAMAVAAGAEKAPEEAPGADSDADIASIVDSVLADMRPKIVEEISRKLGKKK